MRRMLDPTKVGGIPSTIEFDKDGNMEVKKNLGVDGKLTLKSLVSNTNPEGDITKELGGGGSSPKLFVHFITFNGNGTDNIYIQYLSSKSGPYEKVEFFGKILGKKILATGEINYKSHVMYVENYSGSVTAKYLRIEENGGSIYSVTLNNYGFTDEPTPVN